MDVTMLRLTQDGHIYPRAFRAQNSLLLLMTKPVCYDLCSIRIIQASRSDARERRTGAVARPADDVVEFLR